MKTSTRILTILTFGAFAVAVGLLVWPRNDSPAGAFPLNDQTLKEDPALGDLLQHSRNNSQNPEEQTEGQDRLDRLLSPSRLAFRVQDLGGAPIEGVRATLTPLGRHVGPGHWMSRDWATVDRDTIVGESDALGQVSFELAGSGHKQHVIWLTSHNFECRSFVITEEAPLPATLSLAPEPEVRVAVKGLSKGNKFRIEIYGALSLREEAGLSSTEAMARRAFHRTIEMVAEGSRTEVPLPAWPESCALVASSMTQIADSYVGVPREGIEFELSPSFKLGGEVLGCSQEALLGSQVFVQASTSDGMVMLGTIDVTEAKFGPARFPALDADRYVCTLNGGTVITATKTIRPPRPNEFVNLTFEPKTGEKLSLSLVDQENRPVAAAKVWGYWNTPNNWLVTDIAVTDGNGMATIGGLEAAEIWIDTEAVGFKSESFGPFSFPQAPGQGAVFKLARAGTIQGRITHGYEPVDSFELVYWTNDASKNTSKRYEDAVDGRFEIEDAPLGTVRMFASAPPNLPMSEVAVIDVGAEGARVDIRLPAGRRGRGRVIDGVTGEPIPGASVQVHTNYSGALLTPFGQPSRTNQEGTFELSALSPGDARMIVQHPDYELVIAGGYTSESGTTDFGSIPLYKSRELAVELVTEDDLDFSAYSISTEAGIRILPPTPFSEYGLAVFEGCASGHYDFVLRHPDGSRSYVQYYAAEGRDWFVRIPADAGSSLRLTLEPTASTPLPERFTAVFRSGKIEGQYFARVVEGEHTDQIQVTGLLGEDVSVLIYAGGNLASGVFDLSPGDNEATLTLRAPEYRTVEVVDSMGTPVPDMWVRLQCQGQSDSWIEDGRTGIDGLARILAPPCEDVVANISHPSMGQLLDVPVVFSGDPDDIETIEFLADARVRIEILDGKTPVTGVVASLMHPRNNWLLATRSPGSKGRVEWRQVSEGTYVVDVGAPGYWRTRTSVRAEKRPEDQAIQLRKVGNATLELSDAKGPIAAQSVRVTSLDFQTDVQTWVDEERIYLTRGMLTDADGKLELRGLPNGTYRAEVEVPSGATFDEEFVVPRDGTARVEIKLP